MDCSQSTSVAACSSHLYSTAVGRDCWHRPFQHHQSPKLFFPYTICYPHSD